MVVSNAAAVALNSRYDLDDHTAVDGGILEELISEKSSPMDLHVHS